jgi:uncharacterized protein
MGSRAPEPPPSRTLHRAKLALLSWLALWPLLTVILKLIGPALSSQWLPIRTLVLTAILVPTMSFVVMPRLTKLLGQWLAK